MKDISFKALLLAAAWVGTAQPVNAQNFVDSREGAYSPSQTNGSVQDLAANLTRLKSAVEETLPQLQSVNSELAGAPSPETSSNTVQGALSGILSRVLNRNTNSTDQAGQSRTSATLSNLVAIIRGGSSGEAQLGGATQPAEAEVRQQLHELQSSLETTDNLLKRLTGLASTNYSGSGVPQVISRTRSTNYGTLQPTGR